MNLDELAKSLRDFEGVTRKRAIGSVVKWFDADLSSGNFGEDAAVVERGEESLLLAADGIWSKLMDSDPEWAGYCAVLVNIHDILAMGGTPVAMVDVFSANSPDVCNRVLAGMSEAIKKFGVPVVGGHVHPDTSYNALDVAIIGTVKTDSIIYSCGAREGHDVLAAIDLDGRVHPSCSLCWDTTTMKRPEMLRKQLQTMPILAQQHLATAGKDISNPGLIGTLGMLLEVSEAGASIDLDSIPIPDGMDMSEWLRMYPGMGFVLTAQPEHTGAIADIFEEAGMEAAKIGAITDTRKLEIRDNAQKVVVWDFAYDTIMGIGAIACR
jgi:putative methanogenesis marker protein 2